MKIAIPRRFLPPALAVCLIILLAAGGTMAYFNAETPVKKNVFTIGNVSIAMDGLAQISRDGARRVYPGEVLPQNPIVVNDGSIPCFVRVRISGLDALGTGESMIRVSTGGVPGELGPGWVRQDDGYCYYTHVLEAGEKTPPVFDALMIPAAPGRGGDAGTYQVDVQAFAVQAAGAKASWAQGQAMTAEEIAGWFAVCMPEGSGR